MFSFNFEIFLLFFLINKLTLADEYATISKKDLDSSVLSLAKKTITRQSIIECLSVCNADSLCTAVHYKQKNCLLFIYISKSVTLLESNATFIYKKKGAVDIEYKKIYFKIFFFLF